MKRKPCRRFTTARGLILVQFFLYFTALLATSGKSTLKRKVSSGGAKTVHLSDYSHTYVLLNMIHVCSLE